MKSIAPALLLLALTFGCSATDNPLITTPQSVASNVNFALPASVRAPEGHVLLGHVTGRGVATFTLQSTTTETGTGNVWVLTGDEGGDLLDENNALVGHHEGNSWAIREGGQVTGEPIQNIYLPGRAPMTLFQAVSHEGGGLTGSAAFIERVHNVGGPPAALRDAAPGTQFRAEYSADYYFYGSVAPQTRANRGGAYVGG
ncbi:MAG TPA: DUF3455 domain-containing protein [Tepidisphaeraceae bacterium]|nr:DUF3455 domain-containing protein [Tepidisphaeraceae bacterium]